MMTPKEEVDLYNYLEWECGLDPIGSGDMIGDCLQWARTYGHGLSNENIWLGFQASKGWNNYYPGTN